MIITSNSEHTAELRSTGRVGMLDDIHTAIDARTFSIPHAKHTIVFGSLEQVDLLATPDRCRGKVFVYAWLKMNIVAIKVFLRFPYRLVDSA